MAPELFHTMEANELRELAQKIRDWQLAQELSDNALLKKLPQLGSTKTFKRILDNQMEELDLDRQLSNYRAAWAFVESLGGDDREAEEVYNDLYATIQLGKAFAETLREHGPARCVFLIGPSGSGKTMAQRYLMERYGSRLVQVECTVAWNDSPRAMLGSLLDALGQKEVPSGTVDRLEKVVEVLGESRRCVLLEEGHHLGPKCLNLIITLINRTPGEFVIPAIDTLWRRLETRAYEECRQLTGNRLAERIDLGRDVREPDVAKLLERRVQWAGKDRPAMRPLCDRANQYGRLAYIRETIKRANDKADGSPVTVALFADAMAEEAASR